MKEDNKEIKLSDGKIAKIGAFKGKHVVKAQQLIGSESEKMILALISVCVTIDSKPIVIEDLEEMEGSDVLTLMGEFSGNFTVGTK